MDFDEPEPSHERRNKITKKGSSRIKPIKHIRGTLPFIWHEMQVNPRQALKVLRKYARSDREPEVTKEAVEDILRMDARQAKAAIQEFRQPRRWIRSTRTGRCMKIPITLKFLNNGKAVTVVALIDSGATGAYVNRDFAENQGMDTQRLPRPITVSNVDGTLNRDGPIEQVVDLRVITDNEHEDVFTFAVTNTGDVDIILGYEWLKKHNPEVDWAKGTLAFTRCPPECQRRQTRRLWQEEDEEEIEEGDRILVVKMWNDPQRREDQKRREAEYIRAFATKSTQLAGDQAKTKVEVPLEELVPPQYLEDYRRVFEKTEFDRLPERRKWDHAIELKPDAQEFKGKIYPLAPSEQVELDKFIEEHLQSGRIRVSKSPYASPFFFVKKKDG